MFHPTSSLTGCSNWFVLFIWSVGLTKQTRQTKYRASYVGGLFQLPTNRWGVRSGLMGDSAMGLLTVWPV
jgi:hypothetical protein